MKQYNRLKWISAPIVPGGLLWMVGGLVLALRPGGHPPHSFRATMDVMPLLGVGLFLVAGSLGLLGLRRRGERSFPVAAVFCLAGALFYPVGILVRRNFLEGGWEPLMPVGFLLVIAGCLLYGVAGLVTRRFPKPVSVLLILASLSLLGFNDQYTPWMGSVFGAVVTIYGCAALLGYRRPATGAL
ncbi:MAG TPA: hypothetical protein VGE66_06790 [Chitinophagaceae bacterium]